ncbi:hypothetical protein [Streptomyces peucetius]|uniref:Uncharacterized protein n=1 Tax=Streptomyces peucetius TaxID=1950 RepID=A0ABY6ICM6_STRPE|nr:hypothetical protein [Streptomyces peucetius]UYQ64751.1 hypothetical protein OGH68_27055 [Streptomyces peucetius]
MLEAVGGGGAGDLERGLGALQDFQKKVLGLLNDLEGGDASGTKVAEATVTRASFGTGSSFAEADGFFDQYQRVHQAVLSLSKQLSDEIELLRIAVRGADVGFDNLEEDLRLKFHTIKARLDKERDGQAQERETNDFRTGTTDLG